MNLEAINYALLAAQLCDRKNIHDSLVEIARQMAYPPDDQVPTDRTVHIPSGHNAVVVSVAPAGGGGSGKAKSKKTNGHKPKKAPKPRKTGGLLAFATVDEVKASPAFTSGKFTARDLRVALGKDPRRAIVSLRRTGAIVTTGKGVGALNTVAN